MTKLVNRVVGLVVGLVGGILARALFKRLWTAATGQPDVPKATDARRAWGEILLAAALQGAIFAVVRAVLDRGTAQGTSKLTGVWPGDDAGGRSDDGTGSRGRRATGDRG